MPHRTRALIFSLLLFGFMWLLALNHKLLQYLVKMAWSQGRILLSSVPLRELSSSGPHSPMVNENLSRIEDIKHFSVKELGYEPTTHFTRIYPDRGQTLLWVLSAAEPYAIKAYEWSYPLLGRLSYKGFFDKQEALTEKDRLQNLGYDVSLSPVSAWSSLGYWPEPLLEKHLYKPKSAFCELLLHELFHSTFYAPGKVDLNENLADFIAEKACLRYLKNDTLETKRFLEKTRLRRKTADFMLGEAKALKHFYDSIRDLPNRAELKQNRIRSLSQRIARSATGQTEYRQGLAEELLEHKNAAFVPYLQYRSLYDSLDFVFNNFYKGQIKKMVRSLKQGE